MSVDRPVFLLKLAECFVELHRIDDAEKRLREALALRPHLARAHYALGLVYESRGDPAAAAREYTEELASHRDTWSAAFNLGKLLLAQGQPAEAARLFEQAVAAQPEFAPNHFYLAKARLDAGALTAAADAALTGLKRPADARVRAFGHYILADVYSRLARPQDADREAARAKTLESQSR